MKRVSPKELTVLDKAAAASFAAWCALSLVAFLLLSNREWLLDVNENLAERLSGVHRAVWVIADAASIVGFVTAIHVFVGRWWAYGVSSLASTVMVLSALPTTTSYWPLTVWLPIPVLFSGYFARRFWQRADWRHRT
jgi:hypothetical protein